MTSGALVDTDIILKYCRFALIGELGQLLEPLGEIGVLGAAPFMVRKKLSRLPNPQYDKLMIEFAEFEAAVQVVEPSKEEIELATELEEIANRASLGFDSGESQLCAIAIHRAIPWLLTGDKRAIQAAEIIKSLIVDLQNLAGALVCLEQITLGVIAAIGSIEARTHVCPAKEIDTAAAICLRCWSPEAPEDEDVRSAFRSYIDNLRRDAPTMLYAGYEFPSS